MPESLCAATHLVRQWLSEGPDSVVVMEGNQLRGSTLDLPDRRAAIEAARAAVAGLREVLWQAGSAELGDLLGEVDALGQACDAARVALVAEVVDRGDTGSGPAAATLMQWLLHHAPSLRAGGARMVVDLATAFRKQVNAPVLSAVEAGELPVRSAAVVLDEFEMIEPRLTDGAAPHVLTGLIEVAAHQGPRACRRLRLALLARYGLDDVLEREQAAARQFIALSQPQDTGVGVFEYRLRLDLEGKEVLEAAVGPLSAPRPSDGQPDVRGSDRRRGDALLELVTRGVAAVDTVPASAKAQVFVTVDYDVLRSRVTGAASRHSRQREEQGQARPLLRAGTTVGGPGAGSLLAPETVRRLACDASVIPVVLGGGGAIMDWGKARRLFTSAQTTRLWVRDGGCTYPGCSMPPHWTQAHHLVHWADFGPTDLDNAALLCRHHHTTVHSRRLAGTLVRSLDSPERVRWDLTPGSYDQLLARRAAQEPA